MEAVDVDGVLIYLIDDTKRNWNLKQYRGISEEFSHQIDHLKLKTVSMVKWFSLNFLPRLRMPKYTPAHK